LFREDTDEVICRASKEIMESSILFKIPKDSLICSFDFFPYKIEIAEAVQDYLNKTNANDRLPLTHKILSAYQLMYLMYTDKESLYKSMNETRQTGQIVRPSEAVEEYVRSLPREVWNREMFDEEDKNLYQILTSEIKEDDSVLGVVDHVKYYVNSKFRKFGVNILPWIQDSRMFQAACSIITSRAFRFSLAEYEVLHNKTLPYMQMGYKQHEKLRHIYSAGGSCLVPLADLCHRKIYTNEKNYNGYETFPTPNYFKIAINKKFAEGEEVKFMERRESPNELLLNVYGFMKHSNPYSMSYFNVKINKKSFTREKSQFCSVLNCFDRPLDDYFENTELDEMNLVVPIKADAINNRVLNAIRLMIVDDKFLKENQLEILQRLGTKQVISYENEMMALAKYRREILNSYNKNQTVNLKLVRKEEIN